MNKCVYCSNQTRPLVALATRVAMAIYIFSSPEPSGSQGELIVYPCSGIWRRCRRRRQQFLTSFPLKPLSQSKPNFMRSLLRKGGRKIFINGPGHMTKMATMPIYGKHR